MNSRHFTTARGVHGIMDLTVPAGGSSISATSVGTGRVFVEASSDFGSIKRILACKLESGIYERDLYVLTCGIGYNEI